MPQSQKDQETLKSAAEIKRLRTRAGGLLYLSAFFRLGAIASIVKGSLCGLCSHGAYVSAAIVFAVIGVWLTIEADDLKATIAWRQKFVDYE